MHDIYCLPDFGNSHKITIHHFFYYLPYLQNVLGPSVPFPVPAPHPTPYWKEDVRLRTLLTFWIFLNNETLHYTGNLQVSFLYLFIRISHHVNVKKIYTFHMTTFMLHGAILYFVSVCTSYNHIHVIPVLLLIKCFIRSRFKTRTKTGL